jgi:hypothetical protein
VDSLKESYCHNPIPNFKVTWGNFSLSRVDRKLRKNVYNDYFSTCNQDRSNPGRAHKGTQIPVAFCACINPRSLANTKTWRNHHTKIRKLKKKKRINKYTNRLRWVINRILLNFQFVIHMPSLSLSFLV